MAWDLGIGTAVKGISDAVGEWASSGAKKTRAKADESIKVARAKADEAIKTVQSHGQTERARIEAEAGTKRALIKKSIRKLRRWAFVILVAPFAIGAAIIAGEYAYALWYGVAAAPDFTPLALFWSEVVDKTPDWWVKSLQRALAFIWAAGEAVSVASDAGGAVMDHLRDRDDKRVREREADAESRRAEADREEKRAAAEREQRNREREQRGEQPVEDDESDRPSRVPPPPGPR